MKKTFNGLVLAGESLIRCALIATREVRAAEAAGALPEEVARLQLLADSAYEAAAGYQYHAAGLGKTTIH
ncbi:hypothetical protein G7007_10945 [Pseudomonas entomophila]|uniref:hypothetical protein n=1 Tax=Pseudomonas entomophila TaxID=312306 RepID=UPI0015E27137|nr:hypothetical protein [Pseudomonas entomophila]MBA1193376.1 hypothetical protein [Pseudomonas entomophila]